MIELIVDIYNYFANLRWFDWIGLLTCLFIWYSFVPVARTGMIDWGRKQD